MGFVNVLKWAQTKVSKRWALGSKSGWGWVRNHFLTHFWWTHFRHSTQTRFEAHFKFRKIPAPLKIKSALPPSPNPKYPPPLHKAFYGHGGFPAEILGAHQIGAAISGPRIAHKNFTDTRIFLRVAFWENGFCADFDVWAAGFVRGFCRRIFSPHFCGKKCPEKSSRKIPCKILQNLYNRNPRHISAEGSGQFF